MKIQLLTLVFCAAVMSAGAQLPGYDAESLQRQKYQLFSDQFQNKLTQFSTNNRELVQVYDSIYMWDWNEATTQWDIKVRQFDLQLDENYNVVGSTLQSWNGSMWENLSFQFQEINDNGDSIINTQQQWINNSYVNMERIITELGHPDWYMTTNTVQAWEGGNWINQYKWTLSNTDEGPLGYELDQVWDGSEWVNLTLVEYIYDDLWGLDPKVVQTLISEWTGEWHPVARYSLTYDQDDRITSQLEEFFDEGAWTNVTMDTLFTYDAEGNNTGYNRNYWTGGDWIDMFKIENTYDMQNNITSSQVFQWMNSWSLLLKDISHYTYDDNNFIMGESLLHYEGSATQPFAGDSTYYIYHTDLTGIGELPVESASVFVYPNPLNGEINITSSVPVQSMEILDLSGRKLDLPNHTWQEEIKIDISHIPSGVYILRLMTEVGPFARKVIKN